MNPSKAETFEESKAEARKILTEKSKDPAGPLITYSELANAIKSRRYSVREHAFWELLTQLSLEDHNDGLPLLSAIVVDKVQRLPGPGFWKLARSLGQLPENSTPSESTIYWLQEVNKIKEYPYFPAHSK